jgi:hypothetical protein
MNCPICQTPLKWLFTNTFCPNDCDRKTTTLVGPKYYLHSSGMKALIVERSEDKPDVWAYAGTAWGTKSKIIEEYMNVELQYWIKNGPDSKIRHPIFYKGNPDNIGTGKCPPAAYIYLLES